MARAIIDRYPAVWRQRYADEMLALIDAQTLRWRDVADLARRCLIERSRALFEPGDHPYLAGLLAGGSNGGLSMLTGLVIAIVASATGRAWAGAFGPVSDWLTIPAVLIIGAGWVQPIRVMWRRSLGVNVSRPAEPLWRVVTSILVLFTAVVIFQSGASADDTTLPWWSAWWQVLLFAHQFDRLWPSNGLPAALNQRMVAREQMKFAQMELTRCELLAAEGRVSDELPRAQAEMQRWQTQYDDAMHALHGMGYRATFQ